MRLRDNVGIAWSVGCRSLSSTLREEEGLRHREKVDPYVALGEALRERGHVAHLLTSPDSIVSANLRISKQWLHSLEWTPCRPLVCWWKTRRWMRNNPLSFKGWTTQVSRFERCHGVPAEPAHFTSGHADHDANLNSPGPPLLTISGAVDCAAAIKRMRVAGSWCLKEEATARDFWTRCEEVLGVWDWTTSMLRGL